jgi:hypothetical protein
LVTRDEVYAAVDTERDYQDAMRGNAARAKVSDNRDLGSLILFMDTYVGKAKAAFSGAHPAGREASLHEIRKVAALAVLAMELNTAPPRV